MNLQLDYSKKRCFASPPLLLYPQLLIACLIVSGIVHCFLTLRTVHHNGLAFLQCSSKSFLSSPERLHLKYQLTYILLLKKRKKEYQLIYVIFFFLKFSSIRIPFVAIQANKQTLELSVSILNDMEILGPPSYVACGRMTSSRRCCWLRFSIS